MKSIEIHSLPQTKGLGQLIDLLLKYRAALGKSPSCFALSFGQMTLVNQAVLRYENTTKTKVDSVTLHGIELKQSKEC